MGSPFQTTKLQGNIENLSFGREEKLWKKTIDHATSDRAFLLLCQNNSIKLIFFPRTVMPHY